MVKISSDNTLVEKNIVFLCDAIERAGGYIASSVEIIDQAGDTAIIVGADFADDYLCKLPHDVLIPYDQYDFDIEDGDIVIANIDGVSDSAHLKILEAMLSLYNFSGKFQKHLQAHPLLFYSEAPELVQYLMQAREGQDIEIVKNFINNPEYFDELALLTFFKSRLLHCRLFSSEAERSAVLFPVAELMNHHYSGADFESIYAEKISYMATKASMPVSGSREAFACYGRFDALDTYLHYGFINDAAKFIRSIPLKIDLGDIGSILVRGFSAAMPMTSIPHALKDLAFYFPHIEKCPERNMVEMSHVYIPQENARFSLRRILEHVITLLRPDIDDLEGVRIIAEAEAQILQLNSDYYERVIFLAQKDNLDAALGRYAAQMAKTQIHKITHYKNLMSAC